MTGSHHTAGSFKFDRSLFHKMSLLPFFAFVGLGADPVSSSCYGPEEAFISLGIYQHLIVFVGLMTIVTIATISTSYCNIIDLFPYGGGGYVVASKLLSPMAGVVSGCALLVDYVLTITISVASGVDAFFSVLPLEHHAWKLIAKMALLVIMLGLNLRGVKESVFPWIPVFVLFILCHLFAITWAFCSHIDGFQFIVANTTIDLNNAQLNFGTAGLLLLLLKSYSMGAGTYTGIEAVSNGLNMFRPPRQKNAKITMLYLSVTLAFTVSGLILAYLLYHVGPQAGMTLNGVLMHAIGSEMGGLTGKIFSSLTLFSEAAILFVAAQSGFFGGPRVLANMAADRFMPTRFTNLSDRYVMRDGILLISLAAFALMAYSEGSVSYLVVLYSLAVFITFTLAQFGMVRHWTKERLHNRKWLGGLIINGIGCALTLFILITLSCLKFHEGGWLTLLVVTLLTLLCVKIKAYYSNFARHLNALVTDIPPKEPEPVSEMRLERSLHTTVLFVSGLKSLALHSVSETIKLFGKSIETFVFVEIGIIDAGSFKGGEEIKHLEQHVAQEGQQLAKYMQKLGYSAESISSVGLDIGDEAAKVAQIVQQRHPSAIFVGGQLIFPQETSVTHWMHNQVLFTIQRRIFELQLPFITMPIYIRQLEEEQT